MWQPIETAPKDGSSVLICGGTAWPEIGKLYNIREATKAQWLYGKWMVSDTDAYTVEVAKPTHWQPLPAPPVED